ncbi:hypothetical protein [Streptosporangium sp. CA-115845]
MVLAAHGHHATVRAIADELDNRLAGGHPPTHHGTPTSSL